VNIYTIQPTLPRAAAPPPPASSTRSLPSGVVVSRLEADALRATCALCWVGPCDIAGLVSERAAADSLSRPICSRCLVTLEMLALHFGSDLRVQLETPP
jgi:hypothetical protein